MKKEIITNSTLSGTRIFQSQNTQSLENNNGSRKNLFKKMFKMRKSKNYSKMYNVGLIKPIFNHGKINNYNHNQY